MESKWDKNVWIKGGPVQWPAKEIKGPVYRLVLLGAPGVGKGTQAELICAGLSPMQLSTGDVFRAAKNIPDNERSAALNEALTFMKRGDLVPDETVLGIVRERVPCLHCPGGFLLDGFPRTVMQAEALDEILAKEKLPLDAVLNYEMPIDQIVERLAGRRTCEKCKAVYHIANRPSKVAGVCDHCGGKLFQREDDMPASIRVRMEVYAQSTAPLINYYQKQGLLLTLSAAGTPEPLYERTLVELKNKTGH